MKKIGEELDPEERKNAMTTVRKFLQEENDEEVGRLLKLLGCEILNCDMRTLEDALKGD